MKITVSSLLTLPMWLRFLVISLYAFSAAISLYAMIKTRGNYHLVGVIVWCLNVIAFTFCVILRYSGTCEVDTIFLNTWSSVVRIHGGIVVLTLSVYYLRRRLP